ncbi:SDR family oxidoreductase [Nocardioides sp.]|uniref:SDR family oxidoreductase n=1 Tax=Nocardioides sp. TaxID=35761 RepID=UPI0026184A40|nr:SDR family oxidoreductase [Nocardioides sp.]MDI6912323.1 SDR family oxidoreductase [Nocardioides sp.]
MMDLTGRTAIVNGASRGIGRAIAIRFARAGANVVLSSRKQEAVDLVADEIRSADLAGGVASFQAHAGDGEQARLLMERTVQLFGPPDVLVNNAAANPYIGPLAGIDPSRAEKTFQVNQLGPVLWAGAALEAGLGRDRPGSIVNISSNGGLRIDPGIGFYNGTKAALIHLTRQLAFELGPHVRVNAIAPGLVKTDFARTIWETRGEAFAKVLPLRRIGEPDDIASAALFLASDESSWMTGQTIVVDGGAVITPTAT